MQRHERSHWLILGYADGTESVGSHELTALAACRCSRTTFSLRDRFPHRFRRSARSLMPKLLQSAQKVLQG